MSAPSTDNNPFGEQSSGTTDFRLSTLGIISEAFDILQMGVEGEDLSAEMITRGQRSLNMMIATWQAQGIHLWTYAEATLFLVGGERTYKPEQANGANDYYFTGLAADVLATDITGTATLPLQKYGLLDNNPETDWFIGFLKSDNEFFWTTLVSWDDNTGDFEITDEFPENIDENSLMIIYETGIRDIERVLGVRRVDFSVNDTPINFISRQEYFDLPTKLASGFPSEAYYDRDLPIGVLYLWPTPQDGSKFIRLRYERKLFDFVNLDNCADFPKYWTEAICYGLAKRLAMKYRVPQSIYQWVLQMSEETLTEALNFDNANYDLKISLNRESR